MTMDIIDKIKKLIALGTNNTNEKEMALALAKASSQKKNVVSSKMIQKL